MFVDHAALPLAYHPVGFGILCAIGTTTQPEARVLFLGRPEKDMKARRDYEVDKAYPQRSEVTGEE
jgi:hypothetical protein